MAAPARRTPLQGATVLYVRFIRPLFFKHAAQVDPLFKRTNQVMHQRTAPPCHGSSRAFCCALLVWQRRISSWQMHANSIWARWATPQLANRVQLTCAFTAPFLHATCAQLLNSSVAGYAAGLVDKYGPEVAEQAMKLVSPPLIACLLVDVLQEAEALHSPGCFF